MTRYALHVPLYLNDGTPTPERELDDVEARLLDLADGFTATDGIGGWRSPDGSVYREPVRVYALDTSADIGAELKGLAQRVAIALAQEAVYVTAQPIQAAVIPTGVRA